MSWKGDSKLEREADMHADETYGLIMVANVGENKGIAKIYQDGTVGEKALEVLSGVRRQIRGN